MWRVYYNKPGFVAYSFEVWREFGNETEARNFLSTHGYSIEKI